MKNNSVKNAADTIVITDSTFKTLIDEKNIILTVIIEIKKLLLKIVGSPCLRFLDLIFKVIRAIENSVQMKIARQK